ncbi:MAG: response regulator transcription factor [Flavobacteriaceae bacterium]|nr:response regulator transcription factor [Flavobacteriaceae bacterium]
MIQQTAILVDDIPQALEMLQNDIINKHPNIQIIGTAHGVVDAAKLLQKQQPDILFLDIMLGDGTGFDILEIIPNLQSKIIFITASDEYAIKAFKFAAIDYVLKPYSDEDLSLAINKAIKSIRPHQAQLDVLQQAVNNPTQKAQKISLHTLDKIIVVELDEIVRCKSDNNYTTFYFDNGSKIMVTKTLKYFADLLKGSHFIRVHQSHLINTKFIKEYIKSDGGYLVLKDKSTVPVSVRKKTEVLQFLEKI